MSKKRIRTEESRNLDEAERLYNIAKNLRKRGDHKEALEALESAMKLSDLTGSHPFIFCLLGDVQLNYGLEINNKQLLEASLSSFTRQIQLNPTSKYAYEGLVEANNFLNNKEAAKVALLNAVKYGSSVGFISDLAVKVDCKEQVIEFCERYISDSIFAIDDYTKEQFSYHANIQATLINLGNKSANAYASLGLTLQRAEEFKSMVTAFENAVMLEPQNFKRLMDLADALFMSSDNSSRTTEVLLKAIDLAKTSE